MKERCIRTAAYSWDKSALISVNVLLMCLPYKVFYKFRYIFSGIGHDYVVMPVLYGRFWSHGKLCHFAADSHVFLCPVIQKGMERMKIIEVKNLNKTYRRLQKPEGLKESIRSLWKREYEEKEAIKNLDFVMQEGEFVGLIGPNGAGKTTLTKMLTGIIAPTSGEISVLGFYPNDLKNELKQQYAVVMGQKSQLFMELTTNDTLRLLKEIYGLGEKEFQESKEYFTELFGVKDLLNVQVRTLSLGERMKMELMAALLHNPKILFLDEPTIGLDAIASRQIRSFLQEVNRERGTSIILTSHYMEDIQMLCSRSVVINHGVKLYDGDTDKLFEKYQRNKTISAVFSEPVQDIHVPEYAKVLERTADKIVLQIPKEKVREVLEMMMKHHPVDISVEEDEIGAVVERIYEESDLHEKI